LPQTLLVLNGIGPGWEVPVDIGRKIAWATLLLFVLGAFALLTFILNIKKSKKWFIAVADSIYF
jgi:hypothetical protein